MITRPLLTLTLLLTASASLQANWLDDALNKTASSATVLKTGTGTAMSLPGKRYRAPNSSYKLYTMTPPSVAIGCNGIDINLGGFSFISASEVITMLKQIAQGTVTQAFFLAFNQACPSCASALARVEEMNRWATARSIDTCQASKNIASALLKNDQVNACSINSANKNSNSSVLEAAQGKNGDCKDELQALGKLRKCDASSGVEGQADCDNKALSLSNIMGVSSYEIFKAFNIIEKNTADGIEITNLLINLLGTRENGVDVISKGVFADQELYFYLFCGVTDPGLTLSSRNQQMAEEQCKEVWEKAEKTKMSVCQSGTSKDIFGITRCDSIAKEAISIREFVTKATAVNKLGLLQYGYMPTFLKAIDSVQKKIESGSPNASLSVSEVAALSAAPIPIYRLLNLSRHYEPNMVSFVLKDAVHVIAGDIAAQMVREINGLVRSAYLSIKKAGSGDPQIMAPPKELVASLHNSAAKNVTLGTARLLEEDAVKRQLYDNITSKISMMERDLVRTNSDAIMESIQ